MSDPLSTLRADERALLGDLGLDFGAFAQLAVDLAQGTLSPNRVAGHVAPPQPNEIAPLPPAATLQRDALRDAGLQLLAQGRAALLLLNGGMATRFGGRVKGVVDALPGRSFLALQAHRLTELGARLGATPPLLLMNSLATDAATRDHLASGDGFGLPEDRLLLFRQSGAPRLTPEATLHRDAAGELSIYGPGHGDMVGSLRRAGGLAWLRERGVEYLLMANIDNLGASLDPALLGHFAASGQAMMVEVARKRPGDKGGAPARVDGQLKLVEGFAFPEDFDQDRVEVFNTNTLWFRVDALDADFPLRAYHVRKEVDGQPVVQFERLVGQLSWFLPTAWVTVPRERFLPVKTPADLNDLQPRLRELFGTKLKIL